MIDLSIIIVAKNEQRDLPDCINSILVSESISTISFEIIVIDDSEDVTSEIIFKKFSDHIVHCAQVRRQGRCGARNLGIDLSSGKYFIILNADVFLDENYFEFISSVIADKKSGVYLFRDNVLVPENEPFSHYEIYMQGEEWFRYAKNSINPVWTEGFFISRQDLGRTRFMEDVSINLSSGEDLLFGKELADAGVKFTLTDIVVSHRGAKTFSEFALMQRDRGVGGCQIRFVMTDLSGLSVFFIELIKLAKTFALEILLLRSLFNFFGICGQLDSRSISFNKLTLFKLVLFVPFFRCMFGIKYAWRQIFETEKVRA